MTRKNKIVVPNDVFLEKFLEFASADKSIEDLAKELDLSHQGCYQKLRKIRQDLSNEQVKLPQMRLKNAKKTKISIEKLVAIATKQTHGEKTSPENV
jgi:predicted DNA-binding protein YlxM (UPF0122 family)